MADKPANTRVAPWLLLVLLAGLLHVHAADPTAWDGPRLAAPEVACPACATLGSGMDAPPMPVDLPVQAPLIEVALQPITFSLPTHERPALAVRGPPSIPAV